MAELYAPFVRTGNPIVFMDIASAEVTKYAANAMLAARISFMNQIAEFCEKVGADVGMVRKGIGTDRRIGPAFLFPGPGYGGSCFPKDVKALIRSGTDVGLRFDLLEAVEGVNERQKLLLFRKVQRALGDPLGGKRIGVWGMAFKAETDDMRESPSIPLIRSLVGHGVQVRAHDPKAMESARQYFGDTIGYAKDPYDALEGADALVIVTEWLVYRNPDFARIKQLLRRPLIIDGRNLYEPERMATLGFEYHGIGRRKS
jgi:UDPglucose 6-dehydrogenase